MFKKYPEVARTDYDGRHHKFGQRHNACPNSLVYQKYAERLATKLAERYGENPQVTCWHINNEYGGECYCDNCEKAFRVWLKDKYQTIEALNKAWNMEFWGHTVYEWDEIVLPNALSEGIGYDKTAFAGISIDYRRFNSDSLLKNYMMERDAIRKIDPTTPITTNLMGTFKGLDYFKWAKEMDLISWDNYPAYNTPWSLVAMTHDLMRGLKQQPFMLMEQTPSQQNWQPYNSLKKPGQMRAQSYQTIAHGADTIQYFQLRRSIGACEKFHGAVIEHVGHEDTRVFRETAALGAELAQLSDIIGTQTQSQVAVIFDWDNYWALEYTSGPTVDLKYVEQIHRYYRYFHEQNIAVDLVPVDADLSKYKLVAAPVLYMIKEGMQERLTDFVKQGGSLLTTYMSGIVDQSDNVHLGGYPGPLRELAGIWVEEIDALAPEQSNGVSLVNEERTGTSNLVSDLIHLETAEALAHYTSNFYAGMPAVTKNMFGDGTVYYFGGQLEDQLQDQLFKTIVEENDITPVIEEATKLEVACRENAEAKFFVIINFHEEAQPLPAMFVGKTDLLTGEVLSSEMMLTQYTTYIVKEERN
jgi:beta-galactosidase